MNSMCRTMKHWAIGIVVGVSFLVIATPVNRVLCGPVAPPVVQQSDLYDFDHSFAPLIAAGREIDRRIVFCGDSSLEPINSALR